MKKVILVDGNNLLFRSFYATSYTGIIMRNSRGFPTNAIYGFITMIHKILEEENPEYMLVAFDKGKTFRHDQYDWYKAGRQAMPEDLKLQFPKAKEVLDAMGIKHFEIDQYEADDIIGTLSRIVDEEDQFVATIISSDKDLLQLISDEVDVKLLKNNGFIRMDRDEFIRTYGVEPKRMVDIKALMGDSSDNIPGVKGIGEKTALKLLGEYGSLDNLYHHIDHISGSIHNKLVEGKNDAYMSYDIATIYRQVPLNFSLEDLKYVGVNEEVFTNLLKEFEFNSLLKKYHLLDKKIEQQKLKMKEERIKVVQYEAFDFSQDFSYFIEVDHLGYSKGNVLGIGFCNGDEVTFVQADSIFKTKDIFANSSEKYTYDVKKSIVCLNKFGIEIKHVVFDTMIGTYLLDHIADDISDIAKCYSYDIPSYEDIFGSIKKKKKVDLETLEAECLLKAQFIYETKEQILKQIEEYDEMELFQEIEMPLSFVLADMELTGIKVDKNYLDKFSVELNAKIIDLTESIYQDAGCEFNIMSPRKLADILFNKLAIPYPKKTKNNSYSTSKDILDKIIDTHPIIQKILDYRMITKLYATYAEGLKMEIREDGRIHTIFNQTLTRTGRLSSISPNLQNIPIRDEYGRLVRKAFVPDDNSIILSSDYSQVELRIFTHVSKVGHLKEAFIEDKDIHTKTASDIFGISEEFVDRDMRRTAKAVNFGILYGISSFGLSEDLGVNIIDAKGFLDHYLNTYPGIKEYMEKQKKEAYQNGFVKTLMNRRRVIPELQSKNYMVRTQGERIALNTPIQGTSADILKKAMVEIFHEFNQRNLKSKMLIQVHDELIFNVVLEEEKEVTEIVRDIMENTYQLSVPLKVDIETGKNWYEAK